MLSHLQFFPGGDRACRLAILLAIEYAWNVYPSTNLSSGVLVAANAALLVGVWFGYPEGKSAYSRDGDAKIE